MQKSADIRILISRGRNRGTIPSRNRSQSDVGTYSMIFWAPQSLGSLTSFHKLRPPPVHTGCCPWWPLVALAFPKAVFSPARTTWETLTHGQVCHEMQPSPLLRRLKVSNYFPQDSPSVMLLSLITADSSAPADSVNQTPVVLVSF